MKMNKALLPLLLCCFIFPASGKDAGWQWYNEKINPKEKENKPVPAAPRQEPDIMQKLTALQTATKRALYEAILYPGVDNFVKYFRLQNYWTQQAGLFTMSAKKAMLAHPELAVQPLQRHGPEPAGGRPGAAATGHCETG